MCGTRFIVCEFKRGGLAGSLEISHSALIEGVLDRFHFNTYSAIPALQLLNISAVEVDKPGGIWLFREVVGRLMWIPNQTRPDIANGIRAVARYLRDPKECHYKTARKFLSNVYETIWRESLHNMGRC